MIHDPPQAEVPRLRYTPLGMTGRVDFRPTRSRRGCHEKSVDAPARGSYYSHHRTTTRMKKISRLKKAAPLILLGLLFGHTPVSQRAQALVGGPFDDNSYPGANADGTYSGTLTGVNLIGIVSFGVSSSQETTGRFSVFHEGFVHYGAAAGIADLASRRVAGSLLGVAALGGNGNGGGTVETVGGSGNLQSSNQTLTVRSSLEGSFLAKMKGYPQRITFEGEGRLSSSANNAVMTGESNLVISYSTISVTPAVPDTTLQPQSFQNVNLDGQLQVANIRSQTAFKVRGSRTSRTVFTALTNYAQLTPSRPLAGTPTPTATP